MALAKFKVGDRVTCNDWERTYYKIRGGVVTRVVYFGKRRGHLYRVNWDGYSNQDSRCSFIRFLERNLRTEDLIYNLVVD